MFSLLSLPKSTQCSSASPHDRRHSLFGLTPSSSLTTKAKESNTKESRKQKCKEKARKWKSSSLEKEQRQSLLYATNADGIPLDDPPRYSTLYTTPPTISISPDPDQTPNTRTSTSASRPTHLRRPSQPWTAPPNASRTAPTSPLSPVSPVSPVSPDTGVFSPFSNPSSYWDGTSQHAAGTQGQGQGEIQKTRRSGSGAWERIGERRAREQAMRRSLGY